MLIRKLGPTGVEAWHYEGRLITQTATMTQVEAFFNIDDRDDGYIVWRRGDRMVEWFFTDRWYNIFEVHDVIDDHLKGWYCNITYPAQITDDTISWADLALDVWVDPAGITQLLDATEYDEIPLDAATHEQVHLAIQNIRSLVAQRLYPFDGIRPD